MNIIRDPDNPETRAVKLESYKETSASPSSKAGPYIGFYVSSAVENLECLSEEGDIRKVGPQDEFFASIEEQTGPTGEKIEYLRYDPVSKSTPQYKLRENGEKEDTDLPYFLTVPARFLKHGSDFPFAGYNEGDKVNVEIDFLNNLIRVYRVGDYYVRYSDLLSEGAPPFFKGTAAIPLSTIIQQNTAQDAETSQIQVGESDTFEIRPFNSLNENLLRIVNNYSERYSKSFVYGGRREVHIGLIHDFIDQLQLETDIQSEIIVSHRNSQHSVEPLSAKGLASYEICIPRQGSTSVEIQSSIGNNAVEFMWKPTVTTDANWGVTMSGSMTKSIDFTFKENGKHVIYVPLPKKMDVETQENILNRDLSNTTGIIGNTFEWTGTEILE